MENPQGFDALSDEVLMKHVQEGDSAAFQVLVTRYKGRIVGYLNRTVRNTELAEDIAQEAFLRVYTKAHTFRTSASFSAWFYRIATNLAINELRRKKRVRFVSMEKPIVSDSGDQFSREFEDEGEIGPAENLEQRELQAEVARAVSELPMKYRVAFVLREVQGFSYQKISEVVGAPMGTIKSRVNRARLQFRDSMAPYVESEG